MAIYHFHFCFITIELRRYNKVFEIYLTYFYVKCFFLIFFNPTNKEKLYKRSNRINQIKNKSTNSISIETNK